MMPGASGLSVSVETRIVNGPLLHRGAHWAAAVGLRRNGRLWDLIEVVRPLPDHGQLSVGPATVNVCPAEFMEAALYRGTYERAEMDIVERLVKPGDTCVDIGANIGLYTLVLAALTGPSGRVIAFEPLPGVADRLFAAVEHLQQVELRRVALGRRPGTAEMQTFTDNAAISTLRESGWDPDERIKVEVRTLAEEIHHNADFVKMDVEGFESEVIASDGGLITGGRTGAALIEVSPDYGDTEFVAELRATGLCTFHVQRQPDKSRLRLRTCLVPVTSAANVGRQFSLLVIRPERLDLVRDLIS